MDIYKDPKKIKEEIDREILESLKKDMSWINLDWKSHKDNLPKNGQLPTTKVAGLP